MIVGLQINEVGTLRKLYLIFKDLTRQMSRENIGAFSANAAFFIFLSLIPMLIMICTIIPFTPLTEENLLEVMKDITPRAFDPLIINLVSQVYDKSAGILSVAALVTVWSAGKGVLALIRGLNEVNDVVEERNYLLLRLVASFYTVVVLVMMVLSLIIVVFGNVIVSVIVNRIPQMAILFEGLLNLRVLLVWVVLTAFLTLMYT